ncbi:hypothetical protein [Rhizobium mongolense]|uniref:hypothetical protein n=1 Tax=Rhizobium mongolense TaxID=57676 RepID=UPI0034A22FF3
MGTKAAKAMLLFAAMMFFAVLALDIAVPALVLSIMALSTWAVTPNASLSRQEGETA